MNVTDLRKAFTAQGIKGAGKWNRANFNEAISTAEIEAYAEDAARKPVAPAKAKRGICTDCGRKEDFRGSELCEQCREYAEWENTHSDEGHSNPDASGADTTGCPVCDPELDPRKPRRGGRSRAGMVIVAQGTEVHKAETFRKAAEKAGWTVTVQTETYELGEDATGAGTRHYATATKGESHIALAWNGRAYDYAESGASFNGKSRKVRNLKEALRLL